MKFELHDGSIEVHWLPRKKITFSVKISSHGVIILGEN